LQPYYDPDAGCLRTSDGTWSEARTAGVKKSEYLLVNIQKAIENGHLWLIDLVKMVISNSYVSLPEAGGYPNKGFLKYTGSSKSSKSPMVTWRSFFNIFAATKLIGC